MRNTSLSEEFGWQKEDLSPFWEPKVAEKQLGIPGEAARRRRRRWRWMEVRSLCFSSPVQFTLTWALQSILDLRCSALQSAAARLIWLFFRE